MGKFLALLIGIAMWVAIFIYVESGVLRAVCLCAVIYLVALYVSSLKKKGGARGDNSGAD